MVKTRRFGRFLRHFDEQPILQVFVIASCKIEVVGSSRTGAQKAVAPPFLKNAKDFPVGESPCDIAVAPLCVTHRRQMEIFTNRRQRPHKRHPSAHTCHIRACAPRSVAIVSLRLPCSRPLQGRFPAV